MKKNLYILIVFFISNFTEIFTNDMTISYSITESPKSLDPALINNEIELNVAVNLYDRLIKLNENNEILPALAYKWESNGNKIIFHIREDAKWSNGTDITSHDFVYSFKRVLKPETGSTYAYLIHNINIKNAENFTNKKVPFSEVGIKALSNKKIEFELNIDLENPIKVIAPFLSYITCSPMNKEFVKKVKEYAKDENSVLSSGPWVLKKWDIDDKFVLHKNPYYYDKNNIKIEKIKIYIIKDPTTAINMYKVGVLNLFLNLERETEYLSQFKNTSDYNTNVTNSATYIEFNLNDKIISNKNIRKAIAYAIDRGRLCKSILKDTALAATSVVPYGFSGKKGDFRKENGDSLFKDNDYQEARKLLEIGKKELGIKELKLKLLTSNVALNQKYAQYLQQELSTKLGIELEIDLSPFNIRIEKQKLGNYQMMLGGWRADYPGYPTSFLDRISTISTIDYIKWKNKKFDDLIRKVETSYSHEEKIQALSDAEKLICDEKIGEFPLIPIIFPLGIHLAKPYVKNVKIYTGSYSPDFRNAYIENHN